MNDTSSTQTLMSQTSDTGYKDFIIRMNERLVERVKGHANLFKVDTKQDLWKIYIAAFQTDALREHYNCNTCKAFIRRFGELAVINGDGSVSSAFWCADDAPEDLKPSIAALEEITSGYLEVKEEVFLTKKDILGTPSAGGWDHLYLNTPAICKHAGYNTARQEMAVKEENRTLVIVDTAHLEKETIAATRRLLKTGQLNNSIKLLAQLEFVSDVVGLRDEGNPVVRRNLLSKMVASAPNGFCHTGNSSLGKLMEDVEKYPGDFGTIKARHNAITASDVYQRPQALPSQGNIKTGEALIEKLGCARSLLRRVARLDELETIWKPSEKENKESNSGVFGHLKTKEEIKPKAFDLPVQTVTWVKFERDVLPTALKIKFNVSGNRDNYIVFVTAVDMDAPPILQWDHAEKRNPVSWYGYLSGRESRSVGLQPGSFVEVQAVTQRPCFWHGNKSTFPKDATFILQGAKESVSSAGVGLFPEILKEEFREIRSTIEAYSNTAVLQGLDEPHAVGVGISEGHEARVSVRVYTEDGEQDYFIDRWE